MDVLSISDCKRLSSWLSYRYFTTSLQLPESSAANNREISTANAILGHLGWAASPPTPAHTWWRGFNNRQRRRWRSGLRGTTSAETGRLAAAVERTVPQVWPPCSLQFALARRCNPRSYDSAHVTRTGLVHDLNSLWYYYYPFKCARPGHRSCCCLALVCRVHLPRSFLLLLVPMFARVLISSERSTSCPSRPIFWLTICSVVMRGHA
jgi:hypothetical protein